MPSRHPETSLSSSPTNDTPVISGFFSIYLKAFSITPNIAREWLFWGTAPSSTNYSKSSKNVLAVKSSWPKDAFADVLSSSLRRYLESRVFGVFKFAGIFSPNFSSRSEVLTYLLYCNSPL